MLNLLKACQSRLTTLSKMDTKIRISVCDGMSWLSCCPCPAMPVRLRISASAPTIPERLPAIPSLRSAEHTSELQSLMRISYAAFYLKKKNPRIMIKHITQYSALHIQTLTQHSTALSNNVEYT